MEGHTFIVSNILDKQSPVIHFYVPARDFSKTDISVMILYVFNDRRLELLYRTSDQFRVTTTRN